MTWVLSVLVFIGIANFLMLIRNNQVCEFRQSIIGAIYEASKEDLDNGIWDAGTWRYEKFHQVSYEQMVYRFWKPLKLENFYSNTDFILPKEVLA